MLPNNIYSDDTRLIDLTVSQLRDLIRLQFQDVIRSITPEPDQTLHGYKEIADALGCSIQTVIKYRKEGKLDGCLIQQPNSRVIMASKNAILKRLKKTSI